MMHSYAGCVTLQASEIEMTYTWLLVEPSDIYVVVGRALTYILLLVEFSDMYLVSEKPNYYAL